MGERRVAHRNRGGLKKPGRGAAPDMSRYRYIIYASKLRLKAIPLGRRRGPITRDPGRETSG